MWHQDRERQSDGDATTTATMKRKRVVGGNEPLLTEKYPSYNFVYGMVASTAKKDKAALDRHQKRQIVMEVYSRLEKNHNFQHHAPPRPCYDDCGGYLENGFDLFPFSLYKLSLDRIDRSLPYYAWDEDRNTWIGNIRFVIHGINHPTRPTSHGAGMCKMFRDKLAEPKDDDERLQHMILSLERIASLDKPGSIAPKKRILPYSAVSACFRNHPDMREEFGKFHQAWEYCKELLIKQRFRWGNILMSDTSTDPLHRRMFAPSLSIIDPKLGPVMGNLEWIPACLNIQSYHKNKGPTLARWSPEAFEKYVLTGSQK